MKYQLKLEINGLPKTVNALGRKHWAVKVKHNRFWEKLVGYEIFKQNLKPSEPLKKAKIEFVRYSSIEPDFDNLVNSFKVIMDALIKNGIIIDDKPSIVGCPTYAWEKCKKKEGKITVEIKEV